MANTNPCAGLAIGNYTGHWVWVCDAKRLLNMEVGITQFANEFLSF